MEQKERPSAVRLLERDFLECRARLLDIAAFLDRLDRYGEADRARDDFRHGAIRRMLHVVASGEPGRVARILRLLSDPTAEPAAEQDIPPGKAVGAWGDPGGR